MAKKMAGIADMSRNYQSSELNISCSSSSSSSSAISSGSAIIPQVSKTPRPVVSEVVGRKLALGNTSGGSNFSQNESDITRSGSSNGYLSARMNMKRRRVGSSTRNSFEDLCLTDQIFHRTIVEVANKWPTLVTTR